MDLKHAVVFYSLIALVIDILFVMASNERGSTRYKSLHVLMNKIKRDLFHVMNAADFISNKIHHLCVKPIGVRDITDNGIYYII